MTEQTPIKDEFLKEIEELALLDKRDYELIRVETADKYNARVGILDEFVEQERKKLQEVKSEIGLFPDILPWTEPVNLPVLLDEIVTILKRYVSFNSDHEPRAIALWVIHTYCIDIAYITPVLFITSAEMRSGKSTLLSIIQKIVFRCIAASSVSPSVIYRVIPKYHPTLIFDEADTYLTAKNEDLRGVINAGHSRSTSNILRTNPDTLEPETFDAFGAKCFAAIRELPSTVEDRSIIIKMRRMIKGSKKEKMRLINEALRKEFLNIERKCVRFTDDNIKKLELITPVLPDKLNDRAADNWFVLLQIAEFAGSEWLMHANEAALSLSHIEEENKSLGVELLEDIRDLFDHTLKNHETVPTLELIDALCADEEAAWATFNNKRQDSRINAKQLSKLLAPYGIRTINNIGHQKRKGYSKAMFQDAFSRYLYAENPGFNATPAISANTSNDGPCTSIFENDSSAIYRSTCSQDNKYMTSIIARADGSTSEQQIKIPQPLADGGIAVIADEYAHLTVVYKETKAET